MEDPIALKVLHLASFSGNIGDNANHMGFRPWFESQLKARVSWTELEIREFYWKERTWDEELVRFINSHDLLVIGGGNYFELWVENSPTGTSIGFDFDTFAKIQIPVFFNALGVDPGQGIPDLCRQRFRSFLDILSSSDRYLVSVRNDGALENLRQHIGPEYADDIRTLPDHGFFAGAGIKASSGPILQNPYITMNLACDMPEVRFSRFEDQTSFAKEIAELVGDMAGNFPSHDFVFVPHIFRDLEIIYITISYLNDRLRRTRLKVAPYGAGDEVAEQSLMIYAKADLVLGMRFHANVCPIGLSRPVLGLSSYLQIENLYRGLALEEYLIQVEVPGFSARAAEQAVSILQRESPNEASLNAMDSVRQQRELFEPVLQRWLHTNRSG